MTIRTRFDIILTSKEEKKMDDKKFNNLMYSMFLVIFTILLVVIHGLIDMDNKNVDKFSEISNKANVSCVVKTNQFLFITVHKIVK